MTAFNNYKTTALADGPIRYHRMSGGPKTNGSSCADIGSQAQNGTYTGSGCTGASSLLRGDSDGATTFASNSYVSLPTTGLPTAASQWTLEAWCKIASIPASGTYALLSFGSTGSLAGAMISMFSNGTTAQFLCDLNGGNHAAGPFSVAANTVYHVLASYDGARVSLFVNGALAGGSSPLTMNISLTYADIGSQSSSFDFFSGTIDEVAIYASALSSVQASNHYNAGLAITKTLGTRLRYAALSTKTLGARVRLSSQKTPTPTIGVRTRLASMSPGGFGCWANGTGTASFDHFRATQYPDPALCLAPVLPNLVNTSVAWTEFVPTNSTRTVKTSLDGVNWTDVTASNGGAIPGLTTQPQPTIDYFTSNTSANYTNTAKSGGSAAAVTYDTANSRVTLSGGSGGLYLYTALSSGDIDLIADIDESDAGGLVWRFVDTNNYYELGAYDDSSSGGFTNQLRLYKVVAGTRSLIGSASTISWPRSTPGTSPYKRIRVTMIGSTITVYFDSSVMQTATDTTFASGQMGLRNDGGTSRYYQLRLQPVGQYVSGSPSGDLATSQFVYTQVTLNTTDPTANPQIHDLTTSAGSASFAPGVVISQLHDPSKPFASFYSAEMDLLTQSSAQSSGDYYWAVNSGALTFSGRYAVPAPWILHSSNLLFTPSVKPTFSADLYRNRQIITNCIGTVTITGERHIADGTATSWQMGYPLFSAPTITVGGVTKTVGQQGFTGKDFYWQANSTAISQDSSAVTIPAGYIISVNYVGQFPTIVIRNNLAEQAARQVVEGGTGIVEAMEDGKLMLVSAAQTHGDGLLARFSNNNTVQVIATTTRSGLQKGQVIPAFLPEHNINNAQLLITNIATTGEQKADGTTLYEYTITATNGPNLSKWSTALGI